MIRHMNARQFKKLCAKAHPLVLKIAPSYLRMSYIADAESHDDWHHSVLKGTKGFGCYSGSYSSYCGPDWSDRSAWHTLTDLVHWHYAEFDAETGDGPEWPAGRSRPKHWKLLLARAERMAAEAPTSQQLKGSAA